MLHRVLILTAFVFVAGGACLLWRAAVDSRRRVDSPSWNWFATAVAAFLLRALAEVLRGRVPGSVDDFNRLGYAMEWARRPFFAQQDHLWLTGPHAAIGVLIWVVHDPMVALLAWSLGAWCVLLAGILRVGRLAGVPDSWSCGGAALFAFFPIAVPLLVSPLPDTMNAGFVLLAIGERIALVRGDGRRWRAILFATLATTLRFESWLVAVGIVGVLAWGVLRRIGKERPWTLPMLAVPLLLPMFWLADSGARLGHPLAFARPPLSPLFHHYSWSGELRFDAAATSGVGGRVRDLLFMLKLFAWQTVPLVPAFAWLWRIERRAARTILAACGIWLSIAAIVTLSGGVAGHAPERLFLAAVAPLFIALAGAFLAAMATRRGRVAAILLGGGFVAHAVVLDMRHAGRLLEHMDTSCIAAGERLRRELGDAPEFLEHLPATERIVVWGLPARGTQGEFHAIAALSGSPKRLRVMWSEVVPFDDRSVRVALFADVPPDAVDAFGFRILAQDGSWMLCARRGVLDSVERAGLRVAGTAGDPTLVDEVSRLEWATCSPPELLPFEKAREWADALVFGGHDDWRLPAKDELWLLRDTGPDNEPAIDPRFRPGPPTVWSGERAGNGAEAWSIDLSREWVAPRPQSFPAGARAVRDVR